MQILFDNATSPNNCSLWGFSLYIKKYNLLFDTGSNGRELIKNMNSVNLDASKIKHLFISHSHWDHIGGIDSIVELNPDITLYLPASLSKHLIKDLKSQVKEVVICSTKPKKLFKNIYTTGLLGDEMPEQSLIINGTKPLLLSGCGHYGIENIVSVSKKIINKDIYMVKGGMHLLKSTQSQIEKTIDKLKQMGVCKVEATHCSGDLAMRLFGNSFS